MALVSWFTRLELFSCATVKCALGAVAKLQEFERTASRLELRGLALGIALS
jgi:hypothetical protein